MTPNPPWPDKTDGLLLPGELLAGKYELMGFLGSGALSSVYLTKGEGGGESAIKVLHPGTDDKQKRERFERGAKAGLKLRHPNVVRTLGFGTSSGPHKYINAVGSQEEADEVVFLLMERLVGRDLERFIREDGPMSPDKALELFIPCLEGLAHAHDKGIIHKDIKPSNLFLAQADGKVLLKVLDFDLVHFDPDAPEASQVSPSVVARPTQFSFAGTLQFMAPEYWTWPKDKALPAAFDVYQMGLVLAELVSGRRAVQANNMADCIKAHQEGVLDIPPELRAATGPFGEVLKTALDITHSRRYRNARAFREALAALPVARSRRRALEIVEEDEPLTDFEDAGEAFVNTPKRIQLRTLNAQTNRAIESGVLGEVEAWRRFVGFLEAALASPRPMRETFKDDLQREMAQTYEKKLGDAGEALVVQRQHFEWMLSEVMAQGEAVSNRARRLLEELERLHKHLGECGAWSEVLERVIGLRTPDQHVWLRTQARVHALELEQSERAIELYRAVLELNPDDFESLRELESLLERERRWLALGRFRLERGQIPQAHEALEKHVPELPVGARRNRLLQVCWDLRHSPADERARESLRALADLGQPTPQERARVDAKEKLEAALRERERGLEEAKKALVDVRGELEQVTGRETALKRLQARTRRDCEVKEGLLTERGERVASLEVALEAAEAKHHIAQEGLKKLLSESETRGRTSAARAAQEHQKVEGLKMELEEAHSALEEARTKRNEATTALLAARDTHQASESDQVASRSALETQVDTLNSELKLARTKQRLAELALAPVKKEARQQADELDFGRVELASEKLKTQRLQNELQALKDRRKPSRGIPMVAAGGMLVLTLLLGGSGGALMMLVWPSDDAQGGEGTGDTASAIKTAVDKPRDRKARVDKNPAPKGTDEGDQKESKVKETTYTTDFKTRTPIEHLTFKKIEGGTFKMGAPKGEDGRDDDETLHDVTLTKAFWLQTTEVTQAQWAAVVGNKPFRFDKCGETCPAEQINWWEALHFANALSEKEGKKACFKLIGCKKKPGEDMECEEAEITAPGGDIYKCEGYRLPTEAEWEFAARAGTSGAIYKGKWEVLGQRNAPALDVIAWYGGNSKVTYGGGFDCSDWKEKQFEASRCGPHPVATKEPNEWGMYDMLGNVWEWCWDRYGVYSKTQASDPAGPRPGQSRVLRGGSWYYLARLVRAAERFIRAPGYRFINVGFRLARSYP